MLQLKKKAEFRRAGTGDPVFTYWVIGSDAELAAYKEVAEKIITSNGASRYIPDEADMYNGQPNPHKGNPVFLSFNGPLAQGTELVFTDNGRGGNNIVPQPMDDAPENTPLEREWVRKRNLGEAAEATALANLKAEEVKAQRQKALAARSAFGRMVAPAAKPTTNMSEGHGAVTNPAVGNPNVPAGGSPSGKDTTVKA